VKRRTAHNTGLAKVAVQCSASTFVVKVATFAKPETVIANLIEWIKTSLIKYEFKSSHHTLFKS
jgi:hypothetical protein